MNKVVAKGLKQKSQPHTAKIGHGRSNPLSKAWIIPLVPLLVALLMLLLGQSLGTVLLLFFLYFFTVPLIWLAALLRLLYLWRAKTPGFKLAKIVLVITSIVLVIEAAIAIAYYKRENRTYDPYSAEAVAAGISHAKNDLGLNVPKVVPNGYEVAYAQDSSFGADSVVPNYLKLNYSGLSYKKNGYSYKDSFNIDQYKIVAGMDEYPCIVVPPANDQLKDKESCTQLGNLYYEQTSFNRYKNYYFTQNGVRVSFKQDSSSRTEFSAAEVEKIMLSVF